MLDASSTLVTIKDIFSTISPMMSSLTALFVILAKVSSEKKILDIKEEFRILNYNNKIEHESITKSLKEVTKKSNEQYQVMKECSMNKNLILSLEEIKDNALTYISKDNLKIFISDKCESIICFSKYITDSSFDNITQLDIENRIGIESNKIHNRGLELLGIEFMTMFEISHKKRIDRYMEELTEIVTDNVNSKLKRFKTVTELFMLKTIKDLIETHNTFFR